MTKKLWTTKEICEAYCARKNINTFYGLAKDLQVDHNTTSAWFRGQRIMSNEHAATIAPILDEDPAWLALCLAVEREKSFILAEKMRAVLLAFPNRVALVALALVTLGAVYSVQSVIT